MRDRPSQWCFEHRVEWASFIGGAGFFFFLFTPVHMTRLLARLADFPEDAAVRAVYLFLAAGNLAAGALRIWAGGVIGGERMMSVRVRDDRLLTSGPYAHVRNPIYLSDIMTLAGMGLVVPWPGALLVWTLLAVIYPRIIAYEEEILSARFGPAYAEYAAGVPRLRWKLFSRYPGNVDQFSLKEGLLNNFIYLPLIPGFLVCAESGVLWRGVVVGAIGPVAWIALHFRRNFKSGGLSRKDES